MYCRISKETASANCKSKTKSTKEPIEFGVDATITWNGLFIGDFVIKKVSDGGMQLYSPTVCWIPDEFEIHTTSFDQPVKARKEWSREGAILVSARA